MLGETDNKKEKLLALVKELCQCADPNEAKRKGYQKLERISKRLVQYYDECENCREYTDLIIYHIENTDKFSKPRSKQEIKSYYRDTGSIISHLQSKHKLVSEGQYMSTYMCIGLAIGAALGTIFDYVELGVPIGLCLGLAIGTAIDADYKKKGMVI